MGHKPPGKKGKYHPTADVAGPDIQTSAEPTTEVRRSISLSLATLESIRLAERIVDAHP